MTNNLLSEKLRQLRKSSNLRQIDVAVALDIEQSTYSGYETGRHQPSPDTLMQIADFYGITVDVLMRLACADIRGGDDSSEPYDRPEQTRNETSRKNKRQVSVNYEPVQYARNMAQEISDYLNYATTPFNRKKYASLSEKETYLVYLFSLLDPDEQDDILEYMRIRSRRSSD